MIDTKPAWHSKAKPVQMAKGKWALRDAEGFGVKDAPLFPSARAARQWLTRTRLSAKDVLTVADLIELLKTYPKDLPVTGYNAHEDTDFVTCDSVREGSGAWGLLLPGGERYTGPYLDIMGTL